MAKKSFFLMLAVLLLTFAVVSALKYYRPPSGKAGDVTRFPLHKDGWAAEPEPVAEGVLRLLRPNAVFSALYANSAGAQVDLFFSFFASDNTEGGVHSPRDCMPGSGWTIIGSEPREIWAGERVIPAARLRVKYGESISIVDFWYVTRYGETASDFNLKYYQMRSALSFRPTDVAFVRFVADDTPAGLAALDEFQRSFTPEVYRFLPFK